MTAEFDLTVPTVHSFEQILNRAAAVVSEKGKPRAAVIAPSGQDNLEALAEASRSGLVDLCLIGDKTAIRKCAGTFGITSNSTEFIDVARPDVAIQTAVIMAVNGELDILVKGQIPAVDLIKQLIDRKASFVSGGNTLSHVAVMKPELYPKLLFLSDAVVNMQPDLKTKLALIANAIDIAGIVGVDMPRVAIMAASELISSRMPVTIDAAIIAKMADRGQIEGAYVDGPLSFDVAVDMAAALSKGIKNSAVAGQADILLAPNIETANGVYRAMNLYGRAAMGSIVVGGVVPVVISSRSDSIQTRFNSLALGIMAAMAG